MVGANGVTSLYELLTACVYGAAFTVPGFGYSVSESGTPRNNSADVRRPVLEGLGVSAGNNRNTETRHPRPYELLTA